MKYYNIESVGGITFEAGGELLNVGGGDDTRVARYQNDKSIQSSGVSIDNSDNMTGINNLSVLGDLFIDGTAWVVHSGQVSTSDNIIYINEGEVGTGVTAGQAGIQVDRGSLTDYQFLFVEASDTFRIGEIGSLQAVSTREDSPTPDFVPYWNNALKRFDTAGSMSYNDIKDIIPPGTPMWIYANVAPTGWTISGATGDNLLAVKGGSTYTAGGAQAGGWTVTGLSSVNESVHKHTGASHVHTMPTHVHTGPSHTHLVSGSTNTFGSGLRDEGSGSNTCTPAHSHSMSFTSGAGGTGNTGATDPGNTNSGGTGLGGAGQAHNHTVNQNAAWRPRSQVGIICTKD